jgi:hypothetical protein
MAHFAKIEKNVVTQVIVVANYDCNGGDFPESEPIGQAFIASIGLTGSFLQTSYNGNFRGLYAGIGYTYDPDLDEFIAPPQPTIEEAPSE